MGGHASTVIEGVVEGKGRPLARTRFVFLLFLCAPIAASAEYDSALDAYQRGEYLTAYDGFRPLAERGDAGSQYMLGRLYELGRGDFPSVYEAVRWYRLAALQGHAQAQWRVTRQRDRRRRTVGPCARATRHEDAGAISSRAG